MGRVASLPKTSPAAITSRREGCNRFMIEREHVSNAFRTTGTEPGMCLTNQNVK
jgi:hypothetical protein